ncbi:MAG: hypothetical protein V4574_17960 [Pseudomonadota bacterium]
MKLYVYVCDTLDLMNERASTLDSRAILYQTKGKKGETGWTLQNRLHDTGWSEDVLNDFTDQFIIIVRTDETI